jgi:hypothetical protein
VLQEVDVRDTPHKNVALKQRSASFANLRIERRGYEATANLLADY